ncbi:MAG: imidazoleglycerol-phosphate dehydratase HisB [Acidobacteria bacterium]|nr:MAG: imidazoleglycerol-phosphate dehydratase HisB [Acidobacteriota bacterium]REK07781.1 MAG: imidazoleglycerol-phosphate dehydratase HisB [Acidobacteriota bacterium]
MSTSSDLPAPAAPATETESRRGSVSRETSETRVEAELSLDPPAGGLQRQIEAPNGFFAHMLDALTRHAGFGCRIVADGDTHVDLHHTVEDVGIALGEALRQALGERAGIARFGTAYAPLDEALARAVVDLSGRGFLVLEMEDALRRSWVTRDFPMTLVEDFLHAFADRGRLTLHVDVLRARNGHHAAEAAFKAVALALRQAVARRPGELGVPSTKGTLSR